MKFRVEEIIDQNEVHTNKFILYEILKNNLDKKLGIINNKQNAIKVLKLLNRRWGNERNS